MAAALNLGYTKQMQGFVKLWVCVARPTRAVQLSPAMTNDRWSLLMASRLL